MGSEICVVKDNISMRGTIDRKRTKMHKQELDMDQMHSLTDDFNKDMVSHRLIGLDKIRIKLK